MEKQGVDPDQAIVDVFVPYLTQHAGASVVPQILANDVTAVFCLNDLLALGALGALMDQGVDVPGEMAVIGYDDLEFASALHVPLSSVRQPMHELGHKAATLLIDELQPTGTHRHRREQLRPQLVTRASTSSR
jgi:LacI family transcriptional regulator